MLNRLILLSLSLSLALIPPMVPPVYAQDAAPQAQAAPFPSTPLLTIRFNQRNLYVDKAINNAVNRALQTKPDVIFTTVYHPAMQGGDETNVSKVVNAIRSAGVPDAQIRATRGENRGQAYDEVLVYVQ